MSEISEVAHEVDVENIVFKQELSIPCYLVDPKTGQLIDDHHLVVWDAPELNDAVITQINKIGNSVTSYETPHQVLKQVQEAKRSLAALPGIGHIDPEKLVEVYEQAEADQTVPENYRALIGNFTQVMPLITQEHRRRIAYDSLKRGAAILGHAEDTTLPPSY